MAQKHFEQAQQQKFPDPNSADSYLFYLDTAGYFRTRGKIDWAAEVYEQILKLGDPLAQSTVAEMYHDVGRNAEAAAAMDVILERFNPEQLRSSDLTPEQVRGQKYFFLACLARDNGDEEKHRTELLEAVKNDPNELDALIALYRIPNLEEATRKNVVAMIEVAAARLRQEAAASPDDASAYNEFAWLVGNTTGDMEEALKHALRAVELSPESGAVLDTLAHVYFYGLKDYDKAVETQAKAVEFSPYSGLIRQKYELFRKAADEREAQ
jgi:tetratricopeptide (TPR) repeat protein